MKKLACRMLAVLLLVTSLFAADGSIQAASMPKLNKTSITIEEGDYKKLKLSGVSEEAEDKAVWKSSNSKVASVNKKGRVTGKNAGEAVIAVAVSGKTLKCKVTVESLIDKYTSKVVSLVNEERSSSGLNKLKTSSALTKAAQQRAKEMYENNYLSHERPDGKDWKSIFTEYSITGWTAAGSNLARGQETPAEVMDYWMKDDGKRANILSSNYTHIGVGYYKGYWVELFIGK